MTNTPSIVDSHELGTLLAQFQSDQINNDDLLKLGQMLSVSIHEANDNGELHKWGQLVRRKIDLLFNRPSKIQGLTEADLNYTEELPHL